MPYKRCSTCRNPIEYEAKYYVCSVSTCNRSKTGLFFCSVPCWEAHVPEARHRDAWAEERIAPTRQEAEAQHASERDAVPSPEEASVRRAAKIIGSTVPRTELGSSKTDEDDILVVVSKLKKYVRERAQMNTSDSVMSVLSEHLRALAREAIRNAAADGRKTVMDRDFLPLLGKKG